MSKNPENYSFLEINQEKLMWGAVVFLAGVLGGMGLCHLLNKTEKQSNAHEHPYDKLTSAERFDVLLGKLEVPFTSAEVLQLLLSRMSAGNNHPEY